MDRRIALVALLLPSLAPGQPTPVPRPAVSYWRYGPLLFLGTSHTNWRDDPQINELRSHISEFKPDLVLVEGGAWPSVSSPLDAVAPYGELAYVANLARTLGQRVEDADPDIKLEHSHTSAAYAPDQVNLYYALRMVPQFTRASQQGGQSVQAAMAIWLQLGALSDLPEATFPLRTPDDLQQLCTYAIPSLGAWTNAADGRWWNPRASTPLSFLQAVQSTAVAYRDQYIADRVAAEIRADKRVVVVAGSTHLLAARRLVPIALAKR